MIKRFLLITSLVTLLMAALPLSSATAALDCSRTDLSTKEAIECGSGAASGSNQSPDRAASNLNQTIDSGVNVLSAVIGVVAVVMIIIGGFRYITSAGSAEKISSAKNTLMYALIGLIIVALAQFIAKFVLSRLT